MKDASMSLKQEAAAQFALATPPSGVAAWTVLGLPVADWVLIGTAVLLVLQIGFLLHKWVLLSRSGKES